MANLEAQPKWSSVRLLEAHELARGGLNGNMNEQAKALAERTEFLNQEKASKLEIIHGVFEFGTYAEFNAAKTSLPANCTVVIGEENTGTGAWGLGNNRWDGAVLIKSSYDPSQKLKTNATFVGSNIASIAIDTATKKLTISAGIKVLTNLDSRFEVVAQTVDIPSSTNAYLLCYDRASTIATLKTSKTEADYVLGNVYVNGTEISAYFPFKYTIDGQSVFNQRKGILCASGANINIDTASAKLNIAAGTARLVSDGVNEVVPESSINLPTSNGFYQLRYNLSSKLMSIVALSSSRTFLDVICGVLRKDDDVFTLYGVPYYTVNGKPSKLGVQYGFLATTNSDQINFNTTTGKLVITTAVRLVVDDRSYLMPNTSIDLPTTNSFNSLTYDVANGTVSIDASNTVLNKNKVIFGQLLVKDGEYFVFGILAYQLNGISSLDKFNPTGTMVATTAEAINFNFASKTVEITASTTRLLYGKNATLLPATTVDISEGTHVWGQLIYNIVSKQFSKKRTNVDLTNNEIRVALFHVDQKEVRDVPWYSVNGTPAGGNKDSLKDAEFIIPYGDVEADYDQPELPSYYNLLLTTNGNDYTKVYDMYDALMDAHSDYITKTLLGTDSEENPIYQYQFNMSEVERSNEANTKPKVILISSVHGYEKAGVYNLYYTMKEICERWQADSKLEALKWGVNFIIVPIAVPTGFVLNQRKNGNGVDIARNFTAGWVLGDPSSSTYGGTAPLTQPESIILDALMSNNRDAVYFGSCHNFFTTGEAFIWNASGTKFGVNLAKMLCIRETVKSKQRYTWMPQTNDYYIGYSNVGAPVGSEGMQAVEMYGINAGTFEICERFHWETGTQRYSSAVATVGVESLINWILLNVKHGCALYNSRINL